MRQVAPPRRLGQANVVELDATGLQRIAEAEAGERRAALQQLAERPGQSRRLPAADAERAAQPPGLQVDKRHAAIEQADLDVGDRDHAVALDLGLDLAGRVPLDQRYGGNRPARPVPRRRRPR